MNVKLRVRSEQFVQYRRDKISNYVLIHDRISTFYIMISFAFPLLSLSLLSFCRWKPTASTLAATSLDQSHTIMVHSSYQRDD
jgi:hypothetical protein